MAASEARTFRSMDRHHAPCGQSAGQWPRERTVDDLGNAAVQCQRPGLVRRLPEHLTLVQENLNRIVEALREETV
eukprot:5737518-Alexandrium_andersonii.AAC.1